ncbi:MAG: bifunctional phosphopantothenoylcysteine decarboxylase/phosphopantothenate--cysteine ligase CoaBC [Acidimicrobiia bacterium]|nr:bifunctional phosphopantothenoylcysteine decarboxylase/phosphopantothenate--cysteine ligase CoaBC [Acidimicrobiia bacterium]
MLDGRRVLLAVTGGVAAYKTAYLARRLIEVGAEVKVIMTESAHHFIGPQTFAAITGSPPMASLFGSDSVSPHTELARWAELVIVAPATAATMARLASGLATDLVAATLLATESPVLVAPAMHTEMWEHASTTHNVATLRERGYLFVGPMIGALAGGDEGIGRVAEPEQILEAAEAVFGPRPGALRVLVTAGGTREPVDPVRFLGNRSSGKMGHAVADAAAAQGHQVTLVTSSDVPTLPSVKVVKVETAQEMLEAVEGEEIDVAVMAAAVADFRPASPVDTKLARDEGVDSIELEPTPDILATVVARQDRPFVVGFAAETGDVERAIEKARNKKVDLLVYNNVSEPGSGFGTDTNQVTIIDAEGGTDQWPLMSKREVAARLIERVAEELRARD